MLVFAPGGRGDGALRRPLHHNELFRVVTRIIVEQEVLDSPLLDLERQRGIERVREDITGTEHRGEGMDSQPGTLAEI